MSVHPIESRYGSKEMREIFDENTKLKFMLEVEIAIAKAEAKFGLIPKEAAEAIEKAKTKVKLERVKEIEAIIDHDVMAVVKALDEQCEIKGYVHVGVTSNDILDTSLALQFKSAITLLENKLIQILKILLKLAEENKSVVMVGRTHGQHAIPTTLGYKFAIWADEILRHIERIRQAKERVIVGKTSGAVGTFAALGKKGLAIQKEVMKELGIKPVLTANQVIQRDSHAELIFLLALIAGTFEKIAKEIRNLQRTEIAELMEPFKEKQVGSSTMPHKRNPIKSERICGLTRVVRSNVLVALENIALEHERDLTNSSAERVIIPESFLLVDEILNQAIYVLSNLKINYEKIKENLHLTKGLNMAERVMIELTRRGMSRQEAHEILRQASLEVYNNKEETLLRALQKRKEVIGLINKQELEQLLDPSTYIGCAEELVDEVIERCKVHGIIS